MQILCIRLISLFFENETFFEQNFFYYFILNYKNHTFPVFWPILYIYIHI